MLEDYGYHFPGTDDYYLPGLNRKKEEDVIFTRMQNILAGHPYLGVPREPSKIARGIYVGTTADAENVSLLKRIGVTHLLNCSGGAGGGARRRGNACPRVSFTRDHGLRYMEILAEDGEDFAINAHFRMANNYIWQARKDGGEVLIYSEGVSRSGAICLAYLLHRGMFLLQATRLLKDARRTALCNPGFMRQLIRYAQEQSLIDPEPGKVHGQHDLHEAGFDKARVRAAYLTDVSLTDVWWRPEAKIQNPRAKRDQY